MNFFSEQDQARRYSKHLIGLFLLVVIILLVTTNLLVAVTYWLVDGQLGSDAVHTITSTGDMIELGGQFFVWQRFGKVSAAVCGVIACAMLYKWLQLRGGGKRIAEALGGVRINTNTQDTDMKRVLNVVEEMALASGMPVPSVYLLKGEKGINAFAAGNTPADAVIGVTQGALDQFNREQLQGVIAHEFSHILNGDMRLNIRMIALLHGIVFIGAVGEFLIRGGGRHGLSSTGRSSGDARVFLLGVVLLVLGWLGVFFGELIKAAISRQREYLADASAVQFTRNPQGIADALKIIGGYRPGSQVYSARTREASHMFISRAVGSFTRFETHPSLERRIRCIQPEWNGQFVQRQIKVATPAATSKETIAAAEPLQTVITAGTVAASVVTAVTGRSANKQQQTTVQLIDRLHEQARDSFGASALVYALLLSGDKAVQAKQLDYIKHSGVQGVAIQTVEFAPQIDRLDKSYRLSLLELAIPALKTMSVQQYKRFKKVVLLLIRADQAFEMFEWCLFQVLRHYLDIEFGLSKPSHPSYKKIESIAKQYQLILSTFAYHGHQYSDETAQRAFGCGINSVGLYTMELLPKEQCVLDDFMTAVNKLANCYPLLKPRLLKGLAQCAMYDKTITVEEKEILLAIAAVMDCPMPNLLDEIS